MVIIATRMFLFFVFFFLSSSNQTFRCFAFTPCLSDSVLHAINSFTKVHNNSQYFFSLILPEAFPGGGGACFAGGWGRLADAPVPRQLVSSSSIRSQLALHLLFGGF